MRFARFGIVGCACCLAVSEIALAQKVVSFVAVAEPSAVAQTAARILAQGRYQIVTSETASGLVVGKRSGTPYQLLNSVDCRSTTFKGDVTNTITVTAQSSTGSGSSVQISSDVSLGSFNKEFQECTPHGSVEAAIRQAVLALPAAPGGTGPTPVAISRSVPAAASPAPVSIEQIVNMIKAKLPSDLIQSTIRKSGVGFEATPEILVRLKTAGANDDILRAISDSPVKQPGSPTSRAGLANQPVDAPVPKKNAAPPGRFAFYSGKWEGDGSDSSGPGHLIWDITESDDQISGRIEIIDEQTGTKVMGLISGKVLFKGLQIEFTMTIPRGAIKANPKCEGSLKGLGGRLENGLLSGRYSGKVCGNRVNDGSFTLRLVE